MPELPEVEVTRLSFADRIEGAMVESVSMGKPLRWPLGVSPAALGAGSGRLAGVASIFGCPWRGGKQGQGGLLIHLGMSGSLLFGTNLNEPGAHDHFELRTSQGCCG